MDDYVDDLVEESIINDQLFYSTNKRFINASMHESYLIRLLMTLLDNKDRDELKGKVYNNIYNHTYINKNNYELLYNYTDNQRIVNILVEKFGSEALNKMIVDRDTLIDILKYVDVKKVRLSENAQIIAEGTGLLGKELWERTSDTLRDLNKNNKLNSVLFNSKTFYNDNSKSNYELGKHIIDGDKDNVPKLLLLYLYRLLLDKNVNRLLQLEFYRYLDTINKNIIDSLKIKPEHHYTNKLLGEYYYTLYKRKKINMNNLMSVNPLQLKTILELLLKDALSKNDDSEIGSIINTIREFGVYIDYISIIIPSKNEKWIIWLIRNGYGIIDYNNLLNESYKHKILDYVIKVIKENNPIIILTQELTDTKWLQMLISSMNDISLIIDVYKKGKGSPVFRKWIEDVAINQI